MDREGRHGREGRRRDLSVINLGVVVHPEVHQLPRHRATGPELLGEGGEVVLRQGWVAAVLGPDLPTWQRPPDPPPEKSMCGETRHIKKIKN